MVEHWKINVKQSMPVLDEVWMRKLSMTESFVQQKICQPFLRQKIIEKIALISTDYIRCWSLHPFDSGVFLSIESSLFSFHGVEKKQKEAAILKSDLYDL